MGKWNKQQQKASSNVVIDTVWLSELRRLSNGLSSILTSPSSVAYWPVTSRLCLTDSRACLPCAALLSACGIDHSIPDWHIPL